MLRGGEVYILGDMHSHPGFTSNAFRFMNITLSLFAVFHMCMCIINFDNMVSVHCLGTC
jgi:hypothetical protein